MQDFYLLVFDFLTGRPVNFEALNDRGWRQLGAILRQIHSCSLPGELQQMLGKESFVPFGEGTIDRIRSFCGQADTVLTLEQTGCRDLWVIYESSVLEFSFVVQELGQGATRSHPSVGLCSGDLKGGNILQGEDGDLTILDWDEPVWGPPGLDLMFLTSNPPAFHEGYGQEVKDCAVVDYLLANWL